MQEGRLPAACAGLTQRDARVCIASRECPWMGLPRGAPIERAMAQRSPVSLMLEGQTAPDMGASAVLDRGSGNRRRTGKTSESVNNDIEVCPAPSVLIGLS